MAVTRPRRDRGSGAVFERRTTTKAGRVITRYVGQIDLGYDVDGKRRRKTIYGTSRQDVKEKMAKATRELADRGDLPTSDITVAQWLTYWLEHIAADRLKPGTITGYRTVVSQRLIPALGKHRLERLAPHHIREMHQQIITAGLSSTTAGNAHRVLSSALNDAVREGRLGRNVAAITRAPGKDKSDRSNLTAAEAIQVMKAAADTRNGSTWLFALLLGLRQGERLGLRWSHVDLETREIDVTWSLQRTSWAHGCKPPCGLKAPRCPKRSPEIRRDLEHVTLEDNYVLLAPKTEHSRRVIPLPDIVLIPLERRLAQVEQERRLYDADHNLVWCRPDGGPIRPRDDWQTWRDLLTQCKIRAATLHEARHTTATLLFELGVDQHVITAILGHSEVTVTRGYQHVSRTLARDALNELGTTLALPAV